MSDVISIDYEKMQKVANDFDREAGRVKKVLNDVNAQLNILRRGGWIAEAATKFYQEMDNDVCPGIDRLQSALTMASAKSRDIISTMKSSTDEACACLPRE